jgi:hypothetical protein
MDYYMCRQYHRGVISLSQNDQGQGASNMRSVEIRHKIDRA